MVLRRAFQSSFSAWTTFWCGGGRQRSCGLLSQRPFAVLVGERAKANQPTLAVPVDALERVSIAHGGYGPLRPRCRLAAPQFQRAPLARQADSGLSYCSQILAEERLGPALVQKDSFL